MKKLTIFFLTLLFLMAFYATGFCQTKALEQGIKDFNNENYEEALGNFVEAREQEPESSTAAFYLGMTYRKLENYGEAKPHLEYVVKNNPQPKGTFAEPGILVLIEVLYMLNDLDGASAYLGMAEREKIDPPQTAFLKGLVLAKQEKNEEAIQAFTQAKTLNPKLAVSADFQIAAIHMKEGRLIKSKEVFQGIIAVDPTSDIAAYAKEYAQQAQKGIEERRYLNLKAGFRYEFDDNVMNNAGGNVALNLPSRQSDERQVYTAQVGYNIAGEGYPFSALAQYNFFRSFHNELKEYDVTSHTFFLIPAYAMRTGHLSLQSSYVITYLGSSKFFDFDSKNKYSETVSLTPTYQFNIKDNVHIGQVFFKYKNKNYTDDPGDKNENMDADVYAGEIGYIWLFAKGKGFFNLKYEFSHEDAKGDNWTFNGHKVSLSILYPFFDRLKFNVYGEYFYQDFSNERTYWWIGTPIDRKDESYVGSVSLACQVIKGIDLIAQYTYLKNATNVDIYDYKRNIVSLGIELYY